MGEIVTWSDPSLPSHDAKWKEKILASGRGVVASLPVTEKQKKLLNEAFALKGFKYSVQILSSAAYHVTMEWAKENLIGQITCYAGEIYYFTIKEDATLFGLRWM